MNLLLRLRHWLSPPYSLGTLITVAVSTLTLVAGGLYGLMAYQRLSRETMSTAQHWADSVAELVASNNTAAYLLNDTSAIESSLKEVAKLPGIEAIAIFHGDGRSLAEVRRSGTALQSRIGGPERMSPRQDLNAPPGKLLGEVYESWSSIRVNGAGPLAWIRVHYSLNQRSQELNRLWLESLMGLLLALGLLHVLLPLVIGRTLRPIRALSQFAQDLPERIGSHIDLRSSCLEAEQLAHALNTASREMAEQVTRVQLLVNTAADAIISLDAQSNVISANPAATSIFGRVEQDLLGNPLEQCVPGLNAEQLRTLFGQNEDNFGRPRRIVRHDFFGTRADGTPFPVEISLGEAPYSDRLRYVCIVRDVTDERSAQETSELYERALTSSHNAVFITNARLTSHPIVYINEAFQKITGLPPHKVLGRDLGVFLGQQTYGPQVQELEAALREKRNTNVTLRRAREHDTDLIAEVSLSPVRSGLGTLTHFIGIMSDVTARVQAERAIAERGAQLDAIFSLSPDGFVLFDGNDRLVFANPAFERMTGISWMNNSAAMSLSQFRLELSNLCHGEALLPSLFELTDDAQDSQIRLRLARPQYRVVQARVRRNIAGRKETILYFRDVTHEDEVDRMKSEFLASAAHELRTPMVSILGFTELLLKRNFDEERRVDMLQTIHRQSGLLVKMINELLDLARIESRRGLDLNIAPHPLGELVLNSVKGLMRKDNERQVSVASLPDVMVLIDPEKMQLALNNVLSNAFKYSPQGGEVSLAARVEAMDHKAYVLLEIRDHGMGMKPEQLERAFERFYRADTTGNIPGTGLGLSLVKEVVELHNGRVELASVFGKGSTVRLWIPTATNKTMALDGASQPTSSPAMPLQ